jgi:uncharacterized membrane protein
VDNTPLTEVVRRNIAVVRDIEAEVHRQRTRLDRVSDAISTLIGSPRFLIIQLALIGAWMALNSGLVSKFSPFDPFPFTFMNLVLSGEAIFLTTVVLRAQNRQGREALLQAELQLQVGLLAEQEATKVLEMLRAIHQRLGLNATEDHELGEMIQKTQVELLADELKKSRESAP